jgi:hypothetical protein
MREAPTDLAGANSYARPGWFDGGPSLEKQNC